MAIHGKVGQITSDSVKSRAFINLDTKYGEVIAWSNCYNTPTFMCFDGHTWRIIIFDDQEYANEWLDSEDGRLNYWKKILQVVENGFSVVKG